MGPFNAEGEPTMTDAQYRYANALDDEPYDDRYDFEGYTDDYDRCQRCDYDQCRCHLIWPAEYPLSAEMETERELILAGMPMTD